MKGSAMRAHLFLACLCMLMLAAGCIGHTREKEPSADREVLRDLDTSFRGWVILGEKVQEVRLCGEDQPRWLIGESPALSKILAHYRDAAAGLPPYAPVFMILSGQKATNSGPAETEDVAGFQATDLIGLEPRGHCHSDQISVASPLPGSRLDGAFTVRGRARGPWYFEGDFPLRLMDRQGDIVGEHFASAQGPWMTGDWVPFEGEIGPSRAYVAGWGWLVLERDNPSGLSEFEAEVRIPLFFPTKNSH